MSPRKKKNKRKNLPFGICHLAIAPIRALMSDKSEMISQLLFGECVKIVRKKKNWLYVCCTHDDYKGWIDEKQIVFLYEDEYIEYLENFAICLDQVCSITDNNTSIAITLGSSLPKFDGINFWIADKKYITNGLAIESKNLERTDTIIYKLLMKFYGAPYLWGGRSIFGIDCSGLTQLFYKIIGIKLPRDSQDQATHGELVDFVSFSKIGDLAFFENEEGKIIHVGIILESSKILHASGFVRIDYLDQQGIYNQETKKYTHNLKFIKRYFNQDNVLELRDACLKLQ